jgi:hypothetical protein
MEKTGWLSSAFFGGDGHVSNENDLRRQPEESKKRKPKNGSAIEMQITEQIIYVRNVKKRSKKITEIHCATTPKKN